MCERAHTGTPRKRSLSMLIGVFLLLPSFLPAQQAGLDEARALLDKKKYDEAVSAYSAWIKDNHDNRQMPAVAGEIAPYITDLKEREHLLSEAVEAAQLPSVRHALLVALAQSEEQLGNLLSAQQHYRDASFALPDSKDFDSLLRSAILSFELAEYRNAEAQARIIIETAKTPAIVVRGTVLLSRVYYATGRTDRAWDLLLVDNEISPDLDAAGLFWVYYLSLHSNNEDRARKASELLRKNFPESPETSIVDGKIRRMPSASAVLEATAEKAEPPAGNETPSAGEVGSTAKPPREEDTGVVAIQTGSFSVRENAEYAADDLRDEGFAAAIEERVVSGKTYYRVVVPNISESLLAGTILRLKEAGFEGFPIFE